MTNKEENQPKGKINSKKTEPIKIIESLLNFQASLKITSSALDELFRQINTNTSRLKELQHKLKRDRVLWRFKDLENNLEMILFLAGVFDKPQYLQFEDFLVQVKSVQDI